MADPLTSAELVAIAIGILVGLLVIVVRCIYIRRERQDVPEAAGVIQTVGTESGKGSKDKIPITDTVVDKIAVDALFAGSLAWITVQIALLLLSFGGLVAPSRPWYEDSGTLWIIIVIMGVQLFNRVRKSFSSKF